MKSKLRRITYIPLSSEGDFGFTLSKRTATEEDWNGPEGRGISIKWNPITDPQNGYGGSYKEDYAKIEELVGRIDVDEYDETPPCFFQPDALEFVYEGKKKFIFFTHEEIPNQIVLIMKKHVSKNFLEIIKNH